MHCFDLLLGNRFAHLVQVGTLHSP